MKKKYYFAKMLMLGPKKFAKMLMLVGIFCENVDVGWDFFCENVDVDLSNPIPVFKMYR